MKVELTVNGKEITADVEHRTLLVHFLRDTADLTATNIGCDTTSCGACTVLLDDESVKSCTVLAAQADGRSVTTLEEYQAMFAGVSRETAIGEASPLYLPMGPKAARRIHHYAPKAKLIAILRDPVQRAYSHFLHNRKQGSEPCARFSEALRPSFLMTKFVRETVRHGVEPHSNALWHLLPLKSRITFPNLPAIRCDQCDYTENQQASEGAFHAQCVRHSK